jgi:hypothetical protein
VLRNTQDASKYLVCISRNANVGIKVWGFRI